MAPPSSNLEAELKYSLATEVEKRFMRHEEKRRQEIKTERAKWFEKLAGYYRVCPVGADWSNGRPGGSPSELRAPKQTVSKRKLRGSEPVGRRKTSASRRTSTKRKDFQLCRSTAPGKLNAPCVGSELQNGLGIVGQQRSIENVSDLGERLNEDSDWVDVCDDEKENDHCVDLQQDDFVIL